MAARKLELLSSAMAVAGVVSRLTRIKKPDKILSIDVDFLLADWTRVESETATNGECLRYGYYISYKEPIEGKLYASVLVAAAPTSTYSIKQTKKNPVVRCHGCEAGSHHQ